MTIFINKNHTIIHGMDVSHTLQAIKGKIRCDAPLILCELTANSQHNNVSSLIPHNHET